MTIRCYILNPATVFAARVQSGQTYNYPTARTQWDRDTTGAYTDVQPEMTVLFGTSAGDDDLGRQRIRSAPDADTIFFGRSSEGVRDGEVDLEDDAYITVLNEYRVWAKIPYIEVDGANVTYYKDHNIQVGSKTGADKPPVANIGPGAGFADDIDGSNIITVDMVATDSLAIASGATLSTYSWDVDDGTITAGAGTSSITATFPAGFRWVRLTVTDSNGNSHTTVYPVYARDPASDTTVPVNIVDHAITPQGQSIALEVLQDIDEGTYPDGTLVMVWEGAPASASDRDHMTFVGYHQTDPTGIFAGREATLADTTLFCLDAAMKLDTLPAFPQSVSNAASPSTWLEMSNLNADLMCHYLLHWHSNFLDIANWQWSGTGSTFAHVRFDTGGDSLWSQVADLMAELYPAYRCTFSRQGEARIIVDPMLQDTGDRTATVQKALTEAEWTRIDYEHQRPPRLHWKREGAIIADTTGENTVFCVAPGKAPGQGLTETEDFIGLTPDQTTLNATAGHRYARENAFQTPFTIELTDDYGIEPADMTWVTLTMTARGRRGLSLSAENGLPLEMSIAYENGRAGLVKTVELLWERETDGTPAVTYTIPDSEVPDYPDDDPTDPGTEPFPETGGGSGLGAAYVMLGDALIVTSDLSASSPSWTDIAPTITGLGSTDWLSYFILDPWSPGDTGDLVTRGGSVYKSTNLDLSPGSVTWTEKLDSTTINSNVTESITSVGITMIRGSINQQDYLAIYFATTGNDEQRVYCGVSTDGGDNWSFYLIDGPGPDGIAANGAFDIVPHSIGGSLVLYAASESDAEDIYIYKSADAGQTWSEVTSIAGSGTGRNPAPLIAPYDNNSDGNYLITHASVDTITPDGIIESTDGGENWSTLYNTGFTEVDVELRTAIHVYTGDRNIITLCFDDGRIVQSTDGSSFSVISTAANTPDTTAHGFGGFPYEPEQFYLITDSGIYVTQDNCATWTDKTGDWTGGFNFPGGNGGHGVIVPLWTE